MYIQLTASTVVMKSKVDAPEGANNYKWAVINNCYRGGGGEILMQQP